MIKNIQKMQKSLDIIYTTNMHCIAEIGKAFKIK